MVYKGNQVYSKPYAELVAELLLQPKPLLEPARQAFLASYQIGKKSNRFTKVQMDYRADQVLQTYFHDNRTRIENWFNIIGPKQGSVDILKSQLTTLRAKNWRKVYEL